MDGPCAVVAAVLVHDKRFPRVGVGSPAGEGDHRTHYWALRQQARCCFPAGEQGWLSPRLWWWGVVFDLWIVVASIERSGMGFPVVDVQFFQIGLYFYCCKCLRAHGGCLGTGSR